MLRSRLTKLTKKAAPKMGMSLQKKSNCCLAYLIIFEVLAAKAGVNNTHAIFLLKVSCERSSLCRKDRYPSGPHESRSNGCDSLKSLFLFSHFAFTGYLITHSW